MFFGRGELNIAQKSFFREKLASLIDLACNEDTERDAQGVHRSLVKCRQFVCTFRRKLESALDLFHRQFAQVLVDDIAHVLKIDGEGNDLHRPPSLAFIETSARKFGHIKLDRLVETVDG